MTLRLFSPIRVAIRGGGDLGSGVAYRLFVSGFPVLVTELAHPLLLRRAVSFGSAVIDGEIEVEGVRARCVTTLSEALEVQETGIPVLVDADGTSLAEFGPAVLVDCRMLKKAPEKPPLRPPLLIGLGPGFEAPADCDVVIETNRGHRMGRAITQGRAEEDTSRPEGMMGHDSDRVLHAPAAGLIQGIVPIGASLQRGETVARVGGQDVVAPFKGVLRGLIHDGIRVGPGDKIGDIDPRGDPRNCFTISDKALAVGGGVLQAILSNAQIQQMIRGDLETR